MDIDKILNEAENMQDELHKLHEIISKRQHSKVLSYDALKDVYFMIKIADLQDQIEILKKKL